MYPRFNWVENLSNIYRTSIEHLSTHPLPILLQSSSSPPILPHASSKPPPVLLQTSKIYRKSIEHRSIVDRTSTIEHPSLSASSSVSLQSFSFHLSFLPISPLSFSILHFPPRRQSKSAASAVRPLQYYVPEQAERFQHPCRRL